MTKSVLFAVLTAVLLGITPVRAQDAAAAAPKTETAATAAPAKEAALKAMKEVVEQARQNVAAMPQVDVPQRPAIIEAAARRGAQIQYLGERNGFSGWIIMEGGAPAFIYVSGDEQTIFRGMMYDEKGQAVTVAQTTEAQLRHPEFFGLTKEDVEEAQNSLAGPDKADATTPSAATAATEDNRAPDQVLYDALSVSNYITVGSKEAGAPLLYAFIDPDCPHCKKWLKSIDKDYLQSGKLQLRLIPMGILGDASKARAAYLLAQADPGATLMAHIRGEKEIPAQANVTLDGQQLNLDLFRLWRLDGTPLLMFKDKSGTVMMVRGEPLDMQKLYAQIAPETDR